MAKTVTIQIKVRPDIKAFIRAAADSLGQKMSGFVVGAAMKEANRIQADKVQTPAVSKDVH